MLSNILDYKLILYYTICSASVILAFLYIIHLFIKVVRNNIEYKEMAFVLLWFLVFFTMDNIALLLDIYIQNGYLLVISKTILLICTIGLAIFSYNVLPLFIEDTPMQIKLRDEILKHKTTIMMLERMNADLDEMVKLRTKELYLLALPFNSANGIVITDKLGNILKINKSFAQITGYTEEEVIGQNMRILKSGKQSDEFYINMWNTLLTEGDFSCRICNKRKDGTLYSQFSTISKLTNELGEVTNYVCVFIDIDCTDEHVICS